MNKLRMILVFLLKLLIIKFGSALPNTIRIGKYFSTINKVEFKTKSKFPNAFHLSVYNQSLDKS